MTLTTLHKHFKSTLKGTYPNEEISSFFYLLCDYKFQFNRVDIVLQPDFKPSNDSLLFFKDVLQRLHKNEPIQYIIGTTSFMKMDFKVTPSTLIPRPETEELVEWIITEYKRTKIANKEIKILDIGTGSGCIAVSLAKAIPNAIVSAIDISSSALTVAKYNAAHNQVSITFSEMDILQQTHLLDTYDIIVSNPPYVREKEKKGIRDNVLQYEPNQALFVTDTNPLLFYKKIATLAYNHLKPKGKLYFEINQYLSDESIRLLRRKDFKSIELRKDFLGNHRMLRAII